MVYGTLGGLEIKMAMTSVVRVVHYGMLSNK